jgi:hypothetical protein
MSKVITRELIDNAYTYPQYKELVSKLISENKTTGNTQSEKYVGYTKLNAERTKRIEKTTVITDEACAIAMQVDKEVIFLVIAEAWCGDVAQNLPIISMIADKCDKIRVRILLRDENDHVMQHFLTNGGKSIPVLLIIDADTLEVLGKWGPRPEPAQSMMKEHKQNPVEPYEEVSKKIQLWYAKDKGATLQKEIAAMMRALMLD